MYSIAAITGQSPVSATKPKNLLPQITCSMPASHTAVGLSLLIPPPPKKWGSTTTTAKPACTTNSFVTYSADKPPSSLPKQFETVQENFLNSDPLLGMTDSWTRFAAHVKIAPLLTSQLAFMQAATSGTESQLPAVSSLGVFQLIRGGDSVPNTAALSATHLKPINYPSSDQSETAIIVGLVEYAWICAVLQSRKTTTTSTSEQSVAEILQFKQDVANGTITPAQLVSLSPPSLIASVIAQTMETLEGEFSLCLSFLHDSHSVYATKRGPSSAPLSAGLVEVPFSLTTKKVATASPLSSLIISSAIPAAPVITATPGIPTASVISAPGVPASTASSGPAYYQAVVASDPAWTLHCGSLYQLKDNDVVHLMPTACTVYSPDSSLSDNDSSSKDAVLKADLSPSTTPNALYSVAHRDQILQYDMMSIAFSPVGDIGSRPAVPFTCSCGFSRHPHTHGGAASQPNPHLNDDHDDMDIDCLDSQ